MQLVQTTKAFLALRAKPRLAAACALICPFEPASEMRADLNSDDALGIDCRDRAGRWIETRSAPIGANQSPGLRIQFDQTVDAITDRLRLRVLKSHQDIARVKKIIVWPEATEPPSLPKEASAVGEPPPGPQRPWWLEQVSYPGRSVTVA